MPSFFPHQYLARRSKRINAHVTHAWCAPPASLLFGELTSSPDAGAFFAELADVIAALAFAHRLALYVGTTLARLLAGLRAFPDPRLVLRWSSRCVVSIVSDVLGVTIVTSPDV